jgi:hypothetical protein
MTRLTHDTTRHDTTRHDTTRHDTTRHDTTRHDTTQIHLNDEQLVIALPVGRVPISKRSYMASFGLRPPVAWAMARFTQHHALCGPVGDDHV